ncbi:MAG: hypothetical protein H6710_17035 [Myxococcales bacterium]|nr:hypothetical protein [Myxococcales bacterium]
MSGRALLLALLVVACGGSPAGDHEGAGADPAAAERAQPAAFAAPPPASEADALPAPPPPLDVHGKGTILGEGSSAYSRSRVRQRGSQRSLVFVRDNGSELVQTTIDLRAPDRLALPYAEAQAAALLLVPQPRRVLIIGLGGGTLARFFHRHFHDVEIDAVEIDGEVVRLAGEWFGVVPGPRLRIFTADAIAWIGGADRSYDLIYVDAFLEPSAEGTDNAGVPRGLRQRAILEAIAARLAPDGVVAFNLHFRSGYREHVEAIAEVLPSLMMIKVKGSTQRHVLARREVAPLGAEELGARAAILDADGRFGVDFAARVGEMSAL